MSLFSIKAGSSTTNSAFGRTNQAPAISNNCEKNLSSQFCLNQYDYAPKRYGLRFNPPAIIIEYLIPSTGKLYHHKMKIVGLKKTSDNDEVINTLRDKHSTYFACKQLCEKQLSNLIDKLKKRASSAEDEREGEYAPGSQKTGDFNFEPHLNVKANTLNDLKSTDLSAKGISPGLSTNSLSSTNSSKFEVKSKSLTETFTDNKNDGNGFWDLEDEDEAEVDYQTANLNKLTPEEVRKHKDKMDILFKQNQKKPGDPGFMYDKREEFEPKEKNEWDEDL